VVQTETAISGYDPMGRLTNEQRCVGVGHCASNSGSYPMSFTYDLTGKLLTYPSGYGGLSFTNNYDQVGRLSYIYQGTQAANPLFWAPTYTPAGALSGATLNSPAAINMNRTYDVRQRLTTETDAP
jgi:hypothetical protein